MKDEVEPETMEGKKDPKGGPEFAALRRAREERGLALTDVAAQIGIRPAFLEAMERGELGSRLGAGYVRNMSSRYASYLGLDSGPFAEAEGRSSRSSRRPSHSGSPSSSGSPSPSASTKTADGSDFFTLGSRKWEWDASGSGGEGGKRRRSLLAGALVLAVLTVAVFLGVQLGLAQSVADLVGSGSGGPDSATAGDGGEEGAETMTSPSEEDDAADQDAGATAGESEPDPGDVPPATSSTTTTEAAATEGTESVFSEGSAEGGDEGEPEAGSEEGPPQAGFDLMIVPETEVWFELQYEDEETLFSGMGQEGEELIIEAEGPVHAVVGKPQSLEVYVNGTQASPPNTSLWLITVEGVDVRESE